MKYNPTTDIYTFENGASMRGEEFEKLKEKYPVTWENLVKEDQEKEKMKNPGVLAIEAQLEKIRLEQKERNKMGNGGYGFDLGLQRDLLKQQQIEQQQMMTYTYTNGTTLPMYGQPWCAPGSASTWTTASTEHRVGLPNGIGIHKEMTFETQPQKSFLHEMRESTRKWLSDALPSRQIS